MEWNILSIESKQFSLRIPYPTKLTYSIDGGMKVFHDKQKLKHYMTTNPPLQKILKGILRTEDKNKQNHERMGSIKPHEKNR
jgi:hypothetical protein